MVYPAVPNKGNLENHQFGENDIHKGIKFTYSCSYTITWNDHSWPNVVNLETYERFYDLFLSDVELINVSNGEESTETILNLPAIKDEKKQKVSEIYEPYETAFYECNKIKFVTITENGVDYDFIENITPAPRTDNQGNNNPDSQPGN